MTMGETLVLATNNPGKTRELNQLISSECPLLKLKVIAQSELDIESAEETSVTFVENALIKARHASQRSGYPALADDSGLVVDALNGEPGIYSARYAGESANDAMNNQKLLTQLAGVPQEQRTAHFTCALVFLRHALDPEPVIFQAQWSGEILLSPRGNEGFGYDPLFYIPTLNATAAELDKTIKNQLSHRGQAFKRFSEFLKNEYTLYTP